MTYNGLIQHAVYSTLKEAECLRHHGLDIMHARDQLVISKEHFVMRIEFVGENIVASLSLGSFAAIAQGKRTIPLSDPKCFDDLIAVILNRLSL